MPTQTYNNKWISHKRGSWNVIWKLSDHEWAISDEWMKVLFFPVLSLSRFWWTHQSKSERTTVSQSEIQIKFMYFENPVRWTIFIAVVALSTLKKKNDILPNIVIGILQNICSDLVDWWEASAQRQTAQYPNGNRPNYSYENNSSD